MKLHITTTRDNRTTKSIRGNSKKVEGWDIIDRLAELNDLSTYEFCTRFNPRVYERHVEIPVEQIDALKIA